MSSNRFPQRVFGQGTEPDPRFTLANERTFLAWIRTALALLAGGVAVQALNLHLVDWVKVTVIAVLLALGVITPIYAWISWMRTELALRLNQPLPGPSLALILSLGLTFIGILVRLGLLL